MKWFAIGLALYLLTVMSITNVLIMLSDPEKAPIIADVGKSISGVGMMSGGIGAAAAAVVTGVGQVREAVRSISGKADSDG